MAFVETTQDSDLPPVKNKQSKELTALDIDSNEEGLAFANILLYDERLNVLVYEINRNGCYLGKLKEWIERRWNETANRTTTQNRFIYWRISTQFEI